MDNVLENEKYERNNTGKLHETYGETDLGQNVWAQDNSPLLTLRHLAQDSETNSPHVVILHNVLKYAGKIINILKLYSPQLDINLADRIEGTSDYSFPGQSFVRDFL